MQRQHHKCFEQVSRNSKSSEVLYPLPDIPDPVGSAIELPWLRGKSRRKRAATAAMYYGEAYLRGIPPSEADLAVSNTKDCYTKWWLQQRFQVPNGETSASDGIGPEENTSNRKDMSPPSRVSVVTNDEHPISTKTFHTMETFATGSLHGEAWRLRKKRRPLTPDTDNIEPSIPRFVAVSNDESSNDHLTSSQLDSVSTISKSSNETMSESKKLRAYMKDAKANLLSALKRSHGCTEDYDFQQALQHLEVLYKSSNNDLRAMKSKHTKANDFDGVWLTMSNPKYQECLGRNSQGDYIYTLGRMSFDMFRPAALKCSIQGIFNPIALTAKIPEVVPSSLRREIEAGACLRTYNIVVSFTIESDDEQNINPIQGVMTNYGYILPDPNIPNRFSVWFTGGTIEPNDETDKKEWFKIFGADSAKSELKERAMQLASKVLLGVKLSESLADDGSMSYYLSRPIGGHGNAFVDIAYCDKSLRIIRGQHNSVYVLSKIPQEYLQ